jgi:broad specificity phosphatase PhoE
VARPPGLGGGAPLIPVDLEATLVLVRHGESTWVAERRFQGRGDPPLSPLGARQAALVAERLASPHAPPPLPIPTGPPIGIWHSPLRRAAQTAEAIGLAAALEGTDDPPLHPSGAFTEIAQGRWEGLLASEVQARWPDRLAGWRRDPGRFHAPGGESLTAAAGRVEEGLLEVIGALRSAAAPTTGAGAFHQVGRRTLVPGYHQAPPTHPWAALVAHDGIFRLTLLRLLRLPRSRFWSFPFVLAGISVIDLHDGFAVLRAHDLNAHLAPLLAPDEDAAPGTAGDESAKDDDRARSGAL